MACCNGSLASRYAVPGFSTSPNTVTATGLCAIKIVSPGWSAGPPSPAARMASRSYGAEVFPSRSNRTRAKSCGPL